MGTVAILPVKRFDAAKQRLGTRLGEPERRDLAEAMVADVLDALTRTPGLAAVMVVTAEPRAAALASAAGVQVVPDESERGQSEAAQQGLERARDVGHDEALLVPGDCPTAVPDELETLLALGRSPEHPLVIIVPDRHGTGTNALLLRPPAAIAPGFGPGSYERHVGRAEQAGVAWKVARPPSLLLDVDTAEDLDTLRAALQGRDDVAPRTQDVLRGLAFATGQA